MMMSVEIVQDASSWWLVPISTVPIITTLFIILFVVLFTTLFRWNNDFLIIRHLTFRPLSFPVTLLGGSRNYQYAFRTEHWRLKSFTDLVVFAKSDLRWKIPWLCKRLLVIISPPYQSRVLNCISPIFQKIWLKFWLNIKKKCILSDNPVSGITKNRCVQCDREARDKQKDLIRDINELRVSLIQGPPAQRYIPSILDQYETLNFAFYQTWSF